MSKEYEEIKIFLSCPEDIVKAGIKDVVEKVIEEDNIHFKKLFGISLDLIHWKKNVYLGKGNPRVQDRINEKLIKNCDIYLGILWTRFGSPPGPNQEGMSYSSGTEEEFYLAKSLGKVLWFLFYRYPPHKNKTDPEQLNKVKKFKEELKKEQIWYAEFSKEDELRKLLKENVSNFIEEKYSIKLQKSKSNLKILPTKEDFQKYSKGFFMIGEIEGEQYFYPGVKRIVSDSLQSNEGKVILIVGKPGSGKSVFMSQLYDEFKKQDLEYLIAIRAEFLNETDSPKDVYEFFVKAKDVDNPKVLLLDSLDVLAYSRRRELQEWLVYVDKLKDMKNLWQKLQIK